MLTKYQKDEPTLSAAAKDTTQKAIQALETEFQAKQLKFQQQFDERTKEVDGADHRSVKKVIDDIRVEDGYRDHSRQRAGCGTIIVSADKNLDITDRVVSRLRATPAAKIAAPAAAKPGAPPARPASRPSSDEAADAVISGFLRATRTRR